MTRFYRLLLRAYPRSFREDYAAELARTYEERVRNRGRAGAAVAAVADVLPNAFAMHATILAQDVRDAVRSWRNARGFAVSVVVLTALGVGANTATFSVADFVLLRPLAFPEPDRLVRICDGPRHGGGWGCNNQMTAARWRDFVSLNRSLEAAGAFARGAANLVGAGDPQRVATATVTPEVLPLLGVRPLVGRVFDTVAPRADAQTVVISYGLWQTQFGGDPGIVGSAVSLNGEPYSIAGVMPPHFRFPTEDVQLWIPLVLTEEHYAERDNNYLEGIGRLKPDVRFEQAQRDVNVVAERITAEQPAGSREVGFSFFRQRDEMSPRYRIMLLALCGASLCMLLLTCATLANLLLARAAARARELAVRAALGAGRERLIRQTLTEAVLLALVGGVAGGVVALVMVPLLTHMIPGTLPLGTQPEIDVRAFGIAAALSAFTGLGFGTLPALRVGGRTGFTALRDGARSGGRQQRLRTALVAVEVCLSVVLLVASGLLIRGLLRVQAVDPGFVAANVLTMRTALPLPRYNDRALRDEYYRRVLNDVRALPGVEAAAYISALPLVMGGGISTVLLPGEADRLDDSQNASYRIITPQYFSALRVPLLQGRDVSDGDTRDRELVVVVSESFVRERLPNGDALGRAIQMRGESRTIVGVVGDVKVRGLERESEPQTYIPVSQAPDAVADNYMPKDLVVRSLRPPGDLVPAIRQIIRQADAQQPVSNVRMLADVLGEQTGTRRAQLQVLGALAVLALLIATMGIYGLLAYMVSQRDREIGVRLALGARPESVGRMIVSEGLRLALVGVVAGVGVAYLAGRAMSSLLFGVRPDDPLTFGGVALVCFATTIAACAAPALRAAGIQPGRALRADSGR